MLKMTIDTSGADFDVDLGGKCADILRQVADKLERGDFTGLYESVKDAHGYACGTYRLKSCACPDPCEHLPVRVSK